MKITGTRNLRATRLKPQAQAKAAPQTRAPEVQDSVTLSSAPRRKGFKLGTAFWGGLGATVSAIPLVGAWAITKGAAALPWAMDTEFNESRHSTGKSILAGIAGFIGGTALNVGGTAACLATGSLLPMIPAALAGGYLYGKMAQIDSTLGKWDLFG